jgi:hypothetical protein
MIRHELGDGCVEIKSGNDRGDNNDDSEKPVKKSGAFHESSLFWGGT